MQTNNGEIYPVVWYRRLEGKKEEKIEKDNKFEITTKNKRLILKINEATIEDSGIYSVTIGEHKTTAKLTVNEIPVTFKMPLADQRGKEGHSVTFECTVNRGDKPVKWFVNGDLVKPSDIKSGKYAINQDKTRIQLTVNKLDLINDDDCSITCQVGDKAKSKAKLRVDEDDVRFIERLVDIGVKETESVQFTCRLNKTKYRNKPNQEVKIKWFIKGKELTNSVIKAENQRYSIEQINNLLKLEINSVSNQDAGEVRCEVNGDLYTGAILSVEEEPVTFVKKLTDITCSEIPGKACFECELNKIFSNVVWYKNDIEINDSSKYTISQNGTKHYLTINDVDGKDDANYTIALLGKYEKKSMSVLSVRAAPKIYLSSNYKDTLTVKRGQPIEIDVSYKAHPEPRSKWSFNDDTLRSDSRIKSETVKNTNATLLITKSTREDSGRYVLVLENECGRDKCTINVTVLDKPSPPRNPKVTDITGIV